MEEGGLSRGEIAECMGTCLGESVTRNMLDAYASEARQAHTFPYLRLVVLVKVTGDVRPLQVGAELLGHSVVEDPWLTWVEVGQLVAKKQGIEAALQWARCAAHRGLQP